MKTTTTLYLLFSIFYLLSSPTQAQKPNDLNKETFSFAFLTDIHLQPEDHAVEGFSQAIDSVNRLNPDFVLTGGDLVMDAMEQHYGRTDSLYKLYLNTIKRFKMPVYNTMGNHEIFGLYKESGVSHDHPEFGEKMFEKRIGKSYYAFEHKGWKFIVLNSIEDTHQNGYIGLVDSVQFGWLKAEISKTDPKMPIVVSTHIPLMTIYSQKYSGSTVANDSSLVVVNAKQVLGLFKGHNLKLVLQGHLHTVEDIYVEGVHFITGGSVAAAWWSGPEKGFEEGFIYLTLKKDSFDWRFVDYKWEVKK